MTSERRRELEKRLSRIESAIGFANALQHGDESDRSGLARYCSAAEARGLAAEWGLIKLQLSCPDLRVHKTSLRREKRLDAILERMGSPPTPVKIGGVFRQPFLPIAPDESTS